MQKDNSNFAPINAERALQIEKVLKEGKLAFGNTLNFYNWLKRKPSMLEGNLSIESLYSLMALKKYLTSLEEFNTVYLHDSYRISNKLYSSDLSGFGCKLHGARWNSKGIAHAYILPNIFHWHCLKCLYIPNSRDYAIELDLLYIHLPDNASDIKEITLPKLKTNWIEDDDYSRFIGDEFIKSKQALILKVPSAVVQEEHNFLINPVHPEFKKIKISKTKSFRPDKRLFSI
jgi:RES domain-containing protein